MSRPEASPARSAVFTPIGDEGRAVLVERRLAEAIHAGLLSEGERLPSEAELAQLLGVALVTAREALVSLRGQGLITTVRGRNGGSFVNACVEDVAGSRLAGLSRLELRDRASHYIVVLTGCAELAAERVDPDELDYVRSIPPRERELDVGVWRRAETEFHLAIAALTQSARLTREVIRLEADFGVLMRLPLDDVGHRSGTLARMLLLTSALESGDGAAARVALREQLGDALERVADLHAAVR